MDPRLHPTNFAPYALGLSLFLQANFNNFIPQGGVTVPAASKTNSSQFFTAANAFHKKHGAIISTGALPASQHAQEYWLPTSPLSQEQKRSHILAWLQTVPTFDVTPPSPGPVVDEAKVESLGTLSPAESLSGMLRVRANAWFASSESNSPSDIPAWMQICIASIIAQHKSVTNTCRALKAYFTPSPSPSTRLERKLSTVHSRTRKWLFAQGVEKFGESSALEPTSEECKLIAAFLKQPFVFDENRTHNLPVAIIVAVSKLTLHCPDICRVGAEFMKSSAGIAVSASKLRILSGIVVGAIAELIVAEFMEEHTLESLNNICSSKQEAPCTLSRKQSNQDSDSMSHHPTCAPVKRKSSELEYESESDFQPTESHCNITAEVLTQRLKIGQRLHTTFTSSSTPPQDNVDPIRLDRLSLADQLLAQQLATLKSHSNC